MSFLIGNLPIEDAVFLAPMTGVTDLPFRRMVKKYGAGLVFSEMIASRPTVEKARQQKLSAADYETDYPVGAQIAGCEPEIMAEAARINEDRGASLIDINFGCPVKKIVNNFGGSALMKNEKLAAEIVAAVVGAVKIPVTVKMRLGWDDKSLNAARMAKTAEEIGARMITIHGRTRCQLYNGQANWDAVREIKDGVGIPVIVNGDIISVESAKTALEKSQADGVMIGRGAFGKPWIVNQIARGLKGEDIATPPLFEIRDVILEHYEELLAYHGTYAGIGIARKHIGWYLSGYEGAEEVRGKINKMTEPADVLTALKEYFQKL